MAEKTEISWADATFNPWIGCSKVHQGCTNCYAERDFDKRRGHAKWGPHGTRVITSQANWTKAITWNRKAEKEGRRMRVFCASLADVFEDWLGPISNINGEWLHQCTSCLNPDGTFFQTTTARYDKVKKGYEHVCGEKLFPLTLDDVRRRLFKLIDATPWLDWILVTKRPENVRRMLTCREPGDVNAIVKYHEVLGHLAYDGCDEEAWRGNVWILTSISDQATADKMVPELLGLRDLVPVLGLSIEPLLGPINLDVALSTGDKFVDKHFGWLDLLDWIIVGGESGPNARPMHPDWVRSLRDQATAAGVPFFFKQWGEWLDAPSALALNLHGTHTTYVGDEKLAMRRVGKAAAGRMLDGRTWDEFPTAKGA